MRTAWPSAAVRDALGPVQAPAGDARHPGNRHRGGIRTGSGTVVTRFGIPATALDQPRHAAHARSSGAPPPTWPARAPLGGSRAAVNGPSAAPIRPDRPATRSRAAHFADRSARAVSPPSPHHRPAATGPGTPGTPSLPRAAVPGTPLRAGPLCRARAWPLTGPGGPGRGWIFRMRAARRETRVRGPRSGRSRSEGTRR